MRFHHFGNPDNPKLLLIHGVLTPWQAFMPYIKHFQADWEVIVPELDGHTLGEHSAYHSAQAEAEAIEDYLLSQGIDTLDGLCGLSLGGRIAYLLWRRQRIVIRRLVMDGAPLCGSPALLTSGMTASYLSILRKSRLRDPKTLVNFKKHFLPERMLEPYLAFIDHMDEVSLRRLVKDLRTSVLAPNIPGNTQVLYLHGTAMNEALALRSARLLRKLQPDCRILRFPGEAHCYRAVWQPERWLEAVSPFLNHTHKGE